MDCQPWELIEHAREVHSGAILERVIDAVAWFGEQGYPPPTVALVTFRAGYHSWVVREALAEAERLGQVELRPWRCGIRRVALL
jgi:hypothetical protein